MQLSVFGKTHIGKRRKINQDSILIDPKSKLFVVADGMGGHKGGEVASSLACSTIQEHIQEALKDTTNLNPTEVLTKAYQQATRSIFLEANKPGDQDLHGMGTTMVTIWVYNRVAYIANVGDSRAYCLSQHGMWRLSEDHSLINEQLRAGVLKEEELEHVEGKNIITRSVGFAEEVSVDIFERKVRPDEDYLLCSDGLHGLVTDQWVYELYKKGESDSFIEDLINEANAQGGDDNVSCIYIKVRE